MLVLTDLGAKKLVAWALTDATEFPSIGTVNLFTNDFVPNRAMVLSDFVVPAFPAYEAADLPRAGWSPPTIVNSKAQVERVVSPIAWTNDGDAESVYGYFVVDDDDLSILWADRFPSPIDLPNGFRFRLTARVTGRTDPWG